MPRFTSTKTPQLHLNVLCILQTYLTTDQVPTEIRGVTVTTSEKQKRKCNNVHGSLPSLGHPFFLSTSTVIHQGMAVSYSAVVQVELEGWLWRPNYLTHKAAGCTECHLNSWKPVNSCLISGPCEWTQTSWVPGTSLFYRCRWAYNHVFHRSPVFGLKSRFSQLP